MSQRDSGHGAAVAGWLTALPLRAFAAMSPLVRFAVRSLGGRGLLGMTLVLVAVGTVLGLFPLRAGTVALLRGVATGDVLRPSIVKGPSHRLRWSG